MENKIFKNDGQVFSAINEAEKWLKENGYIFGSMCVPHPIGFAPAKQFSYIAKWLNIEPSERRLLTGHIESEDFRNGDCTIVFYSREETK